MKTVKPTRLSVLTRPYRWQGEDSLGVAVMALAGLEPEPRLYTEQELWRVAAEEGDGALDVGMPKLEAEVLVHGSAYTGPSGQDRACAVRMKVGGLDKSLLVFGDRYWLEGRATEPLPFSEMPLDWSRAYGGPDEPRNVLGRGMVAEQHGRMKLRPLPNVESPTERIESPTQRPTPAGFGPLAHDHPERLALMGRRYDQQWLEQGFPGLPLDADWRCFNTAAPDQRWPGVGALPEAAEYAFWNMHPQRAVLSGRLPQWRARVFVRRIADAAGLEEYPLRLTTACFFPARERVALIWHGSLPISEDDAADIGVIMPALEAAGEPLPHAHYLEVLTQRLDTRHGALHALDDGALAPRALFGADDPLPDIEDRPMVRRLRAGERQDRAEHRSELESLGLNADDFLAPEHPPVEPLTMETMPQRMMALEKEQEAMRATLAAERERALADPDIQQFARDTGIDVERLDQPEPPGAPKAGSNRMDPIAMERQLRQTDMLGEGGAAPARWADDLRPEVRSAYRHTVHLFDRAPAMSPLRASRTRRRVEAVMRGARDLSQANLIGADLSGLDLRGARLTGAMLESADLRGTNLEGCDLAGAVLVGAQLDGASLAHCRLQQANLAAVRAASLRLTGADLTDANLGQVQLSGSDLSGVTLLRAQLPQTRLEGCNLRGASFAEIMWHEASLTDCDLGETQWRQCLLLDATLTRSRWQGARLDRVGLINVNADAIEAEGIRLTACSVTGTSSLAGAVLTRAHLSQCGLRGTVMRDVDLREARLDGCDLSGCDLSSAQLDAVIAPDTLFIRADLTGARLRRAVLIDANLSKAVLTGADLGQANLFRADVSQARIDGGASTAGAYTHGAKLWPKRREPR